MGFCSSGCSSKHGCTGCTKKQWDGDEEEEETTETHHQQQNPPVIIPGVPNELAICCLARIPRGHCPFARQVSRSWRDALNPTTIGPARFRLGISETRVFFCLTDIKRHRRIITWMVLDTVLYSCKAIPSPPIPSSPDDDDITVISGVVLMDGKEVIYTGSEDSSLFSFDISSRKWKPLQFRMNTKCSAFASSFLDGYLYIAGGLDESLEPSRSAKRLKVETGDWEDIKDMSSVRASSSGVVLHGMFFVIGGCHREGVNDLEVHSSAEVWDPCSQEWTLVHNMWPLDIFGKVESPMVAVVLDQLYALRAHKCELMWYNNVTKLWISLGRLPLELCNPDYPYVFGVPQMAGLLGVDKELWIIVHCANNIFVLATVPSMRRELTWRRLPFSFSDFTSLMTAVAITV